MFRADGRVDGRTDGDFDESNCSFW